MLVKIALEMRGNRFYSALHRIRSHIRSGFGGCFYYAGEFIPAGKGPFRTAAAQRAAVNLVRSGRKQR